MQNSANQTLVMPPVDSSIPPPPPPPSAPTPEPTVMPNIDEAPDPIPTPVITSKKHWGTGALVGSVVALLVLVGGVFFGYRAVQQRTNPPSFAGAGCGCYPSQAAGIADGRPSCITNTTSCPNAGNQTACCSTVDTQATPIPQATVCAQGKVGGPCSGLAPASCGADGCKANCTNGQWILDGTNNCGTPGDICSSSCAANTCAGQTCSDSCGTPINGTKDCSGGGGTGTGTTPTVTSYASTNLPLGCFTDGTRDKDKTASVIINGQSMVIDCGCYNSNGVFLGNTASGCNSNINKGPQGNLFNFGWNGSSYTNLSGCQSYLHICPNEAQYLGGCSIGGSSNPRSSFDTTQCNKIQQLDVQCGGTTQAFQSAIITCTTTPPPVTPKKLPCYESCGASNSVCADGLSCQNKNGSQVCWASFCDNTSIPTPTPTPTTTSSFQCKQVTLVKIMRGTTEVPLPTLDKIQLGDVITFRGFAAAVNTTVSKLRFTLTKGATAQTPVVTNTTLVSGQYQADLTVTVDQAVSYSVKAEPVSP